MYSIAQHVLFFSPIRGVIVFYQSLLRRAICAELASLQIIEEYLSKSEISALSVKASDLSCFSLSNCLLDNPSGFDQNYDYGLEKISSNQFIDLLKSSDILVKNDSYIQRLDKKKSLFDQKHIGNFHQQIGSYLLSQRNDTEDWWIFQKFEDDLSLPRNNPYLWTQHKFIQDFFDEDYSGQDWLDFGCGIGYYSNFFSQKNANVLGVDPSSKYIEIAKNKFSNYGAVEYIQSKIEEREDFKMLKGRFFDKIYLSDVFHFYFEPYKPLALSPQILLEELKLHLKPGGKIYIMDPHGCFHLQPWLGEKMPSLLCTEYKNRKYRVTPNLEEVSKVVEQSGLVIQKIRELTSPTDTDDTQAKNISQEFPLWWFFELSVRIGS